MTQWLLETLLATTLLMTLVLLVRPWVSARFGARASYLLWAAPAARMILPPLPATWAATEIAPVRDAVVILAGPSSQPAQAAAVTGGGVAWATILIGLWLGGAAFFFARHWIAYAWFALDMRHGEDEGRVDGIAITRSGAVTSPLALGVFGRRVIVPSDFAHRYDDREQRLALAHELVHHRRFDVAANFFALGMLALHWWNPIAHLAHRAFRIDQEAACDELVLNGASPDDRYAYGTALFKSAMGRVPLAACAMGEPATLKARLRRIVASGAGAHSARTGLSLAAILVTGGVGLTASAAAIEQPVLPQPVIPVAMSAPSPARLVSPIKPVKPIRAVIAPRAVAASPALRPATAPALFAPVAPAQPPAAAIAPKPVALPAPVAVAALIRAGCDGGNVAQVAVRVSRNGTEQRMTRVVMCRPVVRVDSATLTEALRAARESIAAEANLTDDQRLRALAAVDRSLAQLSARGLPAITMQ